MSAYSEWMSMFNPEMEMLLSGEFKHLRKLTMILHAFDKEAIITRTYLQNEYKMFGMHLKELEAKECEPLIELFAPPEVQPPRKPQVQSPPKPQPPKPTMKLKKEPVCTITRPKRKSLRNSVNASPDIFNFSVAGKLNNESDDDVIIYSPEKCSPKIEKKRYPHKMKSKLDIGKRKISVQDIISPAADAVKPKAPLKISVKKKLFEQATNNKSKGMVTLTQMYQNMSNNNKSNINRQQVPTPITQDESMFISQTQRIEPTALTRKNKVENTAGESMIDVDEMIKMVADAQREHEMKQSINDDTEIHNTYKAACEKRQCRFCDQRGSPCTKHREPLTYKEPNQTFSGFWDLDFTLNKNKPGNAMDVVDVNTDGNDSTVLM